MIDARAIIHTLNVYSRYSFTYPYPVAISVNGPVGGMEYPMICFNGPRPNADGNAGADKIRFVGHHSIVGHNYYPMVVNSDRALMDLGDGRRLNTFAVFSSNPREKIISCGAASRKISLII